MPRTCVIVLKWKGLGDTLECLQSIVDSKRSPELIIVCDNASDDGSAHELPAWAEKTFGEKAVAVVDPAELAKIEDPSLRFLFTATHSNLGYAGGNNIGLQYALSYESFDFIWILNNDTIVDKRALLSLEACAQHKPDIDIFGSTVVDHHNDRVQCAGGCRYYPWTSITRPAHGGMTLQEAAEASPPTLDYVYGACMFIRTDVFRSIGLLNEDFFLYYEELDFCRRARAAGFRSDWCSGSIVRHKGGCGIGRRRSDDKMKMSLVAYHENLSTLKYTYRHHPSHAHFTAAFRLLGKFTAMFARGEWEHLPILFSAYYDFYTGGNRFDPSRRKQR